MLADRSGTHELTSKNETKHRHSNERADHVAMILHGSGSSMSIAIGESQVAVSVLHRHETLVIMGTCKRSSRQRVETTAYAVLLRLGIHG
jgi:hypothetical protein